MSVVNLPPDGAKKRYTASQENAVAEKAQLVEKTRLSIEEGLRKKIEAGDILDVGNQSKFGQLVRKYANDMWSFDSIMNEFEHNNENPEKYKKLMYQRQAIEQLFKWIDRGVEIGKEARRQLSDMEKGK